jgi:hypothetical protein
MSITRNGSIMVQGASASGILNYAYGGTSANIAPTTAGNVLFTSDGTNWSSAPNIVRGTAVASTSGTSITFTGIPSWAKRITVMLNGVSTNGASPIQVQIGSGSVTTSGYLSYGGINGSANFSSSQSSTTGFAFAGSAAVNITYGAFSIYTYSGNIYLATFSAGLSGTSLAAYGMVGGGNVTLSGALDRVVLTTINGTDTFDAGSVNILYE